MACHLKARKEAKNALRRLGEDGLACNTGNLRFPFGINEPHTYLLKMHCAYILQSISHPEKFYYGSTSDLKKRVEVHNGGKK